MREMWNNRNNYLMDTYGKKWDGAGKGTRKNVLRQGKQNCFMEDGGCNRRVSRKEAHTN